MGERKFSIIFAPGNESSRERKLAGAKVLHVFAPGSERSLLGNVPSRSREPKYRTAKRAISSRTRMHTKSQLSWSVPIQYTFTQFKEYLIGDCTISCTDLQLVTGYTTRGHNMKFVVPQFRINAYRHSFFPSTIMLWNSLPTSVVMSSSLATFQTNLAATHLLPIPTV